MVIFIHVHLFLALQLFKAVQPIFCSPIASQNTSKQPPAASDYPKLAIQLQNYSNHQWAIQASSELLRSAQLKKLTNLAHIDECWLTCNWRAQYVLYMNLSALLHEHAYRHWLDMPSNKDGGSIQLDSPRYSGAPVRTHIRNRSVAPVLTVTALPDGQQAAAPKVILINPPNLTCIKIICTSLKCMWIWSDLVDWLVVLLHIPT